MNNVLRLEDFGTSFAEPEVDPIDAARLEAECVAAYDKGYAEGWEDAQRAAQKAAEESDTAARATLQDLGFTFHEARAHVMAALSPLLRTIVAHAVPLMIDRTLGERLTEELEAMIAEAGEAEIEIRVGEGEAEKVRRVLDEVGSLPAQVREDATLEPGKVHLRLGTLEREIDPADLERRLGAALDALDHINKDALAHG
ncbi:flagellar assembly protein FliH [Palleronia aestuarii]|uniref:Flagellar assembly protein FliH n=1 Tax=Palleronia aestuarii TaxID=568105 RepID=A0A2W7N4U0_9RHOB|nr:hypothetical protein [Palleronia aestuarii]PZX15090.1 flagellar assembly protein FliH [Palleronia aestuarii]